MGPDDAQMYGKRRRPFGSGGQGLIPSHRKLPRIKAVVVKRGGNAETRFRQARSRGASASEPLRRVSKADWAPACIMSLMGAVLAASANSAEVPAALRQKE